MHVTKLPFNRNAMGKLFEKEFLLSDNSVE